MSAPVAAPARAAGPARPGSAQSRTLGGLARYFLRLGPSGFGGPITLLGYKHRDRDLVEQRRWDTETEYRQGLARYQGLAVVHEIFLGVGPTPLAIIAIAAYRLARTTNKTDPPLWAIAASVAIAVIALGLLLRRRVKVPEPVLAALAAGVGVIALG